MKACAQTHFMVSGIFPREAPSKNRMEMGRGRAFLNKMFVSGKFQSMKQQTFDEICDHVVAVSCKSETVMHSVWKYHKTEFNIQLGKIIRSIVYASPRVFGIGCVDAMTTCSL